MDAEQWSERLKEAVAAEITKLRVARGISKNELSARTGLARSFVTSLEQGQTNPSTTSLAKIGYVLGISPGEILKRSEKQAGPIPRFKKDIQ